MQPHIRFRSSKSQHSLAEDEGSGSFFRSASPVITSLLKNSRRPRSASARFRSIKEPVDSELRGRPYVARTTGLISAAEAADRGTRRVHVPARSLARSSLPIRLTFIPLFPAGPSHSLTAVFIRAAFADYIHPPSAPHLNHSCPTECARRPPSTPDRL